MTIRPFASREHEAYAIAGLSVLALLMGANDFRGVVRDHCDYDDELTIGSFSYEGELQVPHGMFHAFRYHRPQYEFLRSPRNTLDMVDLLLPVGKQVVTRIAADRGLIDPYDVSRPYYPQMAADPKLSMYDYQDTVCFAEDIVSDVFTRLWLAIDMLAVRLMGFHEVAPAHVWEALARSQLAWFLGQTELSKSSDDRDLEARYTAPLEFLEGGTGAQERDASAVA